ncbi:MAG TPA: DUF222 domain-containing protein, partial [Acidimicrobiales bacterium]|nr:DUF222 domain-containing protein [Acidimicrobiales bacterium]
MPDTGGLGDWLFEALAEAEGREAKWLMALGQFDATGAWAADGQLSCAEWLTWRCRMSRSCAYEKLQVARQLRIRPALAQAFEEGRISYSACRAIARMIDPDPSVDEAVIALAETGTVRDVERVVGAYCRHRDQHRRPGNDHGRSVRVRPNLDGTTTIQVTVTDLEAEELMAV